jgi:hypothetical protein
MTLTKITSSTILSIVFLVLFPFLSFSSPTNLCGANDDSTVTTGSKQWTTTYAYGTDRVMVYERPKPFGFIKSLPRDFADFGKYTVKKKSLLWLGAIAASSALLIDYDQHITNETQGFSDRNHIHRNSSYNDVFAPKISGHKVSIISIPKNINTFFYTLGQGYPALLVGGGLYVYGLSHHDTRAVSTASQLAEAFIAMGVATQVVKRMTGRETPIASTEAGGKWQPFPPFKDYQKNTPKYDAFPSGHLATVICAITILSENYPEKKWIKPVGYSIATLVAGAMVNNGVHWAGDYPLAIGIGYAFGKVVSMKSRTFKFKAQ